MREFVTQTQGLDTFQVFEIKEGMQIDTVGLGMLLNNKISGLCSISDINMDNKEYIRYNVSSQISLKQFLMEKIDKRKFITIIDNILSTLESIEEYLLEPGMILLDTEDIYINVSSLKTSLIYYPVVNDMKEFSLKNFVKTIIMSMEFDPTERDNYVSLIINYLNSSNALTITQLREFLVTLNTSQQSQTYYSNQSGFSQNYQQVNNYSSQNTFSQNSQNNYFNPVQNSQNYQNIPSQPVQTNMSVSQFEIPKVDEEKKEKKKSILSSLFTKSPKTQKEKPEKKEKTEKKELFGKKDKNKTTSNTPAGIVIPGMENVKNSTLPDPPKPQGAQLQPQKSFVAMSPFAQNSSQPVMQQPVQPMMQQPVQPVMQQPVQPVMQQPVQPMMQQPVQPVMQQPVQPMMQQPVQPVVQQNYGGTVVLGVEGAAEGATTVLAEGYNTVQRQQLPYLIRKKTNEKVEITKDIFKIGKEQSYVDYWISNNSAISRSHANIIRKENEFFIIDNNSLNHTFLNGKQIPSQQMFKLEDFMLIKMADEMFEFRL